MKKLSLWVCLLFSVLPIHASPVSDLELVGQAKLQVWFWDVYESALYSPDGLYQAGSYPQALEIKYLRDIAAADLIDATREQWQRLSLWSEQSQRWLLTLSDIWPDIRRGDTLVIKVDQQGVSHFYHNGALIGQIDETTFADSFLSIWLSEDTEYPKLRAQLIGVTPP